MLFSCSQKNQFPAKLFEKVAVENIVLNGSLIRGNGTAIADTVRLNNFDKELNELLDCKQFYDEQNKIFDLARMESLWNELKNQRNYFSSTGLNKWIEITGFLLETTGNANYAEEIEGIAYQNYSAFSETGTKEMENRLIPWIFTKNVDHIHVNIFANATIKYEHSLKSAVEITQETNYPESGKIQIKFKMEKKRYIELFIRIPEWAEGATVTAKGVKYVAIPGQYSLVARNWLDGDFVEVIFPSEKIPE
jgi:DUF1680 family protein